MRILILNWGVAEEYSWQHSLFEELAFLGCHIDVISARKAWDPRGGKSYPREEKHDGLSYFRYYEDINTFKLNLESDVEFLLSSLGSKYDIVWTFHQANWKAGCAFAKKLNAKHVLVCEQAFRTSGHQYGQITDRWKEIQRTTDLIISWAPQDGSNEQKLGLKYLPFGGCFRDIESKYVGYGNKIKEPYGIYQGSLSSAFKNQERMVEDISWFLENGVVEKFIINGYPLNHESRNIIQALQKWKDRFHYEMLIGREAVLDVLKGAMFGYSPMKPAILSNFPYEAFGVGVPMYMPYIENAADFILTDKTALLTTLKEPNRYNSIRQNAIAYYNATHSVEIMGQRYYDALGGLL
jgi:hypothetical protein